MMLMQETEINLIRPPLPIARVGRRCDSAGMATEGTFELRHNTSTPAGGVGTNLKLLKVGDSDRQLGQSPGFLKLFSGVHRQ